MERRHLKRGREPLGRVQGLEFGVWDVELIRVQGSQLGVLGFRI